VIAQMTLLIMTPRNSSYPLSLLAKYSADYRRWGNGPLLPALDPHIANAAESSKLGHIRRGLDSDQVPVAIIEAPSAVLPTQQATPTTAPATQQPAPSAVPQPKVLTPTS